MQLGQSVEFYARMTFHMQGCNLVTVQGLQCIILSIGMVVPCMSIYMFMLTHLP